MWLQTTPDLCSLVFGGRPGVDPYPICGGRSQVETRADDETNEQGNWVDLERTES